MPSVISVFDTRFVGSAPALEVGESSVNEGCEAAKYACRQSNLFLSMLSALTRLETFEAWMQDMTFVPQLAGHGSGSFRGRALHNPIQEQYPRIMAYIEGFA